jgi:uncharacterized phage-associated protein
MSVRHRTDWAKAVEVLLYVTTRVPNLYHALKVLYFADKQHLARYGRFIYGDTYVAMRHGPVPSAAYDVLKEARGDALCPTGCHAEELFAPEGNEFFPRRDADLDMLSESDIECLDEAIAEYGHLAIGALKQVSHEDPAFQAVDENDAMTIELIAGTLPDGELVLDYLRNG